MSKLNVGPKSLHNILNELYEVRERIPRRGRLTEEQLIYVREELQLLRNLERVVDIDALIAYHAHMTGVSAEGKKEAQEREERFVRDLRRELDERYSRDEVEGFMEVYDLVKILGKA